MTTVKLERITNRYARDINGAWVSAGADKEEREIDEALLTKRFSLNSGIRVTWPDGTSESAFPLIGGAFASYPPICIPPDGRLAALLNR